MTQNDCYKAGRKITPKGIMVHSTATPGVMAKYWFARWNKEGVKKCAHAFIDDKEVWQYLPWNHRAWHCAGSANNTHIAFEICEPMDYHHKEYFNKAWDNALELCVFLCRKYNLKAKDIISHREGHIKGIASNHGDPDHWWKYQGKTMADFRKAVDILLYTPGIDAEPIKATKPVTYTSPKTIKEVQRYLNAKISLGLDVDGSYGPLTKKALIMYWQKIVGGLSIDGSFGPKSKAAASKNNLRRGSKGDLVRVMQMALICKAHDLNPYGADGSFGEDTEKELKAYQKLRGLESDGVCGSKTWTSLLS